MNSHFFFLSKTNMIDFQFFHWVVELYEYLLPPHFLTYAFTSASEVQLLPVVISVSSHFWLSFISRTSSIATRLLPFMVLKLIQTCLELSAAIYPAAFWTSPLGSWTCLTQLTVCTCFSCILITWHPAVQIRNLYSSLSFTTALKSSTKSYQFPLRNLPQSVSTSPFLVTLP